MLTAFNLDEFCHRRDAEPGEIRSDRRALRLDAEPGTALPVGGNPEIANEALAHDGVPDPDYERPNDRLTMGGASSMKFVDRRRGSEPAAWSIAGKPSFLYCSLPVVGRASLR